MEQTIQNRIELPNGSWLTVDIYGDPFAPTLIVVPGVMSDAKAWQRVARTITGWPTVAVVNRRGRHPSDSLPAGYSLSSEVNDIIQVIQRTPAVSALFGWSYGGLIALTVANHLPLPHVIAYEPVIRPFAGHALRDLKAAFAADDLDQTIEIVCSRISGLDDATIAALRADKQAWESMRELARPVFLETRALNRAHIPKAFAQRADRTDLVIGSLNRGQAPYGTTFEDVHRLTTQSKVHELQAQGHMAHLENPEKLAALLDSIAALVRQPGFVM